MAATLSSGLLSTGPAPLKRYRRLLYGLVFLARPVNLLLMGLTSACTYGLLLRETPALTRYAPLWVQMLLSTLGIAASGYWLNALYDRAIDRINRPLRARWVALVGARRLLRATLTIGAASLLLCVGLPWKVSLLHLAALIALAWYARWGKKTGLPGNALIAFLTGLVPWEVMLLTRTTTYATDWLIPLAIVFNFARELVKDAEDLPGDRLYGVRSLPAQLSPRAWDWLLRGVWGLLLGFTMLPFFVQGLLWDKWAWGYLLLASGGVALPLLGVRWGDYADLSRALKIAMAGGLLAVWAL